MTGFFGIGSGSDLGSLICRGDVKGECLLSDIIFCHYRYRSDEVVLVDLPRVQDLSKKELRDREVLRLSFYNLPKPLIKPEVPLNSGK